MAKYNRAFPASLYPGNLQMVTHITPNEERMKKMYFVFPGKYKPTYSGLPALVITAHQPRGSKRSLSVRVTNMISGEACVLSVRVSATNRKDNHAAMDKVIQLMKKHMWLVGPANPDHYTE